MVVFVVDDIDAGAWCTLQDGWLRRVDLLVEHRIRPIVSQGSFRKYEELNLPISVSAAAYRIGKRREDLIIF